MSGKFFWYFQGTLARVETESVISSAQEHALDFTKPTLLHLTSISIYLFNITRSYEARSRGSFQLVARGWIVTHKRCVASVLSPTPFTVELRPARFPLLSGIVISTETQILILHYLTTNNCYHSLIIY